jgi:hypothetical protein
VEQFVVKRVVTVVVTALIAEAALLGAARMAPAFDEVVRGAMWVVAGAFLVAVWRAARQRGPGADRRHRDRRGPPA